MKAFTIGLLIVIAILLATSAFWWEPLNNQLGPVGTLSVVALLAAVISAITPFVQHFYPHRSENQPQGGSIDVDGNFTASNKAKVAGGNIVEGDRAGSASASSGSISVGGDFKATGSKVAAGDIIENNQGGGNDKT